MSDSRQFPDHRFWLGLILVIYLALALGYGVLNPLFEAPDEHHHYFTAQTISESGRLPRVDRDHDPWMGQEAAQPPLYYLLAANLIGPIQTEQARDLVWFNPYVRLGDASSPNNTNAFVHTSTEVWPWQGHVLAAHLVRVFSALFGLGTLLCIYFSGRLVLADPPRHALLATALVAFLPQYVFLHGSISNDTAIIFLCSAALWQLLYMWRIKISWQRLLLLGVTIGLAILSKTAGLLLLLYSIGFLTILVWRNKLQPTPQLTSNLGRLVGHIRFGDDRRKGVCLRQND